MRHYSKAALMRGAAPFERKDDGGADIAKLVKGAMEPFMTAFEALKAKNDERLSAIEKKGDADAIVKEHVDRINAAVAETKKALENEILAIKRQVAFAGGGERKEETAELKEYRPAFYDWFRKGGEENERKMRALEAKALSVGSDPDGGFTVLPEMDRAIIDVLKQVSPMRQLASVRTMGTASLKKLVNQRGTSSGWVGETDPRNQTNTSQLSELEFPAMEMWAMPAATQSSLDDSWMNLEQWIAGEVDTEFAFQEGRAFVLGNGAKQPSGFLAAYPIVANASYAWGRIGYVATGAAGAFASSNPADAIVQLFHAIKSPLRGNASWASSNNTLATLRTLKDGQGNYLIRPKFSDDGVVETMMGKPVTEVVDMPDIGANSYSLAFADWKRSYIIVDRMGTRVLRDPYTAKPYVLFYTTKRVGGGVQNFEAIKLLKFATS